MKLQTEPSIGNQELSFNVYSTVMLCTLSVVGAYLLAELVEINRIARLWMHGASFFRYQFTFLVLFGGALTIYAIREQKRRRLSTIKLTAVRAVGAFLCAVLALFILPAFSARNMLANLTSAEGRRALVVGAGLTLSWLTGILTGVLAGTLLQGKRRAIVILRA